MMNTAPLFLLQSESSGWISLLAPSIIRNDVPSLKRDGSLVAGRIKPPLALGNFREPEMWK